VKRITRRLMTGGLLTVIAMLVSSGAAEARIALNHNETLLRDGT